MEFIVPKRLVDYGVLEPLKTRSETGYYPANLSCSWGRP